jgi:hypothetical protein
MKRFVDDARMAGSKSWAVSSSQGGKMAKMRVAVFLGFLAVLAPIVSGEAN